MDFAVLVDTSMILNPNCPRSVILSKPKTTVGRYAEVKMDTSKSHEISKYHAVIACKEIRRDYNWSIEDLFSLNGTFLNGIKVKDWALKANDEIVFGGGSCFVYGDQIESTDAADCRYRFIVPDPAISFSENLCKDELLPAEKDCGECPICYLPMLAKTELPCKHVFCRGCLADWAKKCADRKNDFVCPICRETYSEKSAKPPCILIESANSIKVLNPECFLRKIDMRSLGEVEELSVTKRWTAEIKEKFWNSLDKLEKSRKKLWLFRWLTKCSYRALKGCDAEALLNVAWNMEWETSALDEELRYEVIWVVAVKVHGVPGQIPSPGAGNRSTGLTDDNVQIC
jgi:hypothetical protein